MFNKRFFSFIFIVSFLFSTAVFPTDMTAKAQPAAAVMAAPAEFGKLLPTDKSLVTTSRVMLTWEASITPGVKYEYCVFTKQSCPPGQYKSVGSSLNVTVTLKPNTVYYWQVRAYTTSGTYTYANNNTPWKFTTGSAAPSAFVKSSPSNGATNQPTNVTVSWTQSTGLNVNYQVCYDTTNNNTCDNNVWLLAGTATSYNINGLNYDTTYYWQVRAYNGKGTVYANGSLSAFWSFRTQAAPPTPFTKLTPTDGSTGMPLNVSLIWSHSTGANITYQYCIAADPVNNTCKTSNTGWVSTGSSTTAAPAGLEYNKTYYWQVRALTNGSIAAAVEANGGTWWSFNTLITPPTSFTKLLPADDAVDVSRTPNLYWSASTGTGITYEYCLIPGNVPAHPHCVDADFKTNSTNTFVTISPALLNNTPYIWQVRTRDAGNTLVYANDGAEWNFTTLPAPPAWVPPASGFSTPEDPAAPYTAHLDATNPNGKTLIYTLSGRAPAGTFLLSANGDFTFNPEANFNGDVTFSFTIWDGANEPAGPYTATISVTPVNDKPVILPIEDVSVFTGADIFFTIETTDADLAYGDTLTLTLIGTLPTGATFIVSTDPVTHATSGDFDWAGAVWTISHPGPYTFTAKVTDADGAFSEDPFIVAVTSNTVYIPIVRR